MGQFLKNRFFSRKLPCKNLKKTKFRPRTEIFELTVHHTQRNQNLPPQQQQQNPPNFNNQTQQVLNNLNTLNNFTINNSALNNYPNLSSVNQQQQQHNNAHLAHFNHNPKHHEDALARRQAQISQSTATFDDCLPPQVGKYVDLQLLEAPAKSKQGGGGGGGVRNKQNSKRGGKNGNKQPSIDSIPGQTGVSKVFQNYKSTCYKATCLDDGVIYSVFGNDCKKV